MIRKISVFKIGLLMAIIGIGWMSYQFSLAEKASVNSILSVDESIQLETNLEQSLGYYKISMSELGDSVFVQIIDSFGQVISDKKIETKSSVNYFDPGYDGRHTIKVTNLKNYPIKIDIEFGNTNSQNMEYAGIIVLSGILLVIFSSFRKLYYYKIAQPDENNS